MDQSEFMNKFYEMDPRTEGLLSNGLKLRDGMRVLCENPATRPLTGMTTGDLVGSGLEQALRYSRWALVSDVEMASETAIGFVATYDDGTKKKIVRTISDGWYVKLDSIPADEAPSVAEGWAYTINVEILRAVLKDFMLRVQAEQFSDTQRPLSVYAINTYAQLAVAEVIEQSTGTNGSIGAGQVRDIIIDSLREISEEQKGHYPVDVTYGRVYYHADKALSAILEGTIKTPEVSSPDANTPQLPFEYSDALGKKLGKIHKPPMQLLLREGRIPYDSPATIHNRLIGGSETPLPKIPPLKDINPELISGPETPEEK